MNSLFVTATGTDIGKTFVSARLAAELLASGRSVLALKPLATGFDQAALERSDTGVLLAAQGLPATADNVDRITPWRFRAPLAPDMAAAREGRSIELAALLEHCRRADAETVLIEGIGGVMTPLDGRHTVLDWISELAVPALLVTGSYLGSLSHTLTALAVLRGRGVPIAGVVVSESLEQPVPPEDTVRALERYAAPARIALLRRPPPADAPRLCDLLAL